MSTNGALPHDLDAEACTLGSMILDVQACFSISKSLSPEDFYGANNRIIFEVLLGLAAQHSAVDVVMVRDALEASGRLAEAGGAAYLATLIESVPTGENGPYYAEMVANQSILRKVVTTSHAAIASVEARSEPAIKIAQSAADEMLAAATSQKKRGPRPVREILDAFIDDLESKHGTGSKKYVTSLGALNQLANGFGPGELIVIAARPGMGKSAMMRRIALDLMAHGPILYFSIEEPEHEVVGKIVSARSGKAYNRIDSGKLDDADWGGVVDQANQLYEAPLLIDDDPWVSMHDVTLRARETHTRKNVVAVFIDYLQLLAIPRAVSKQSNRAQQVAWSTKRAKILGRELGCPVFLAAQLNRRPEERVDGRPRVSDLRESGSIENDADKVILLHRPEHHAKQKGLDCPSEWRGVMDIIVGKNRSGPVGGCAVKMQLETMNLTDLTMDESTAYYASKRKDPNGKRRTKKERPRKDWGNTD